MPAKGMIANQIAGGWNYYTIDLKCAGTGGETQPYLDRKQFNEGNPTQYGRFQQDLDTGWVNGQVQIQFVAASTIGAGSAYVLSLPRPVVRAFPGKADPTPIGKAMCYWSGSWASGQRNSNLPCIVTAADPFVSLNGLEDRWAQIYAPEILSQGTATIINGTQTITVAHDLGYAFNAVDVEYNCTSSNVASTNAFVSVTAVTSSDLTFGTRNNATSPGLDISWKVRARVGMPTGSTGALVSPTVPWAWSQFTSLGPFGNIFVKLGYEGVLP